MSYKSNINEEETMGRYPCLVEIKRLYEVLPGSDFDEVVKTAMQIVKKNNCIVGFNFNGIEVCVYKDTTLEFARARYETEYKHYRRLGPNDKCEFKQM